MDLKGLLSKRVAGVPVMAFVLILSVGALYAASRMSSGDEPEDVTDEDVPSGDITDAANPVFVARDDGTLTDTHTGTTYGEFDTDAWRRQAVAWLMANKKASASFAQKTVDAYLAGDDLSYGQGKWRNDLINAIGLPPELPDHAGRTGKKPPANTWVYTTKRGDTLVSVAHSHRMTVTRFRFLNKSMAKRANGYKIPVGTKVVLDK